MEKQKKKKPEELGFSPEAKDYFDGMSSQLVDQLRSNCQLVAHMAGVDEVSATHAEYVFTTSTANHKKYISDQFVVGVGCAICGGGLEGAITSVFLQLPWATVGDLLVAAAAFFVALMSSYRKG